MAKPTVASVSEEVSELKNELAAMAQAQTELIAALRAQVSPNSAPAAPVAKTVTKRFVAKTEPQYIRKNGRREEIGANAEFMLVRLNLATGEVLKRIAFVDNREELAEILASGADLL